MGNKKLLDTIYKHFSWIIIVLSLIAYFFYQTIKFEGTIETLISDYNTWVHLVFVIFLNLLVVSASLDKGTREGLSSPEFELANEMNNILIKEINNNLDEFREYVDLLNEHEKKLVREDFLFKVGKRTYEELTPKEKRKFNKLKPIVHYIYGINLPLFYETTGSKNRIEYSANYNVQEHKFKRQFTKTITGLMFGLMTVNATFQFQNIGDALISVLIIGAGLTATYITNVYRPIFRLKYEIPKKVLTKKNLFDGFKEYKAKGVI